MTIKDLQKDIELFNHTTLRSKAKAQYFYVAKTREDIINLFNLSKENKLKFLVIGGGSNVALLSDYIKGIVVKNNYIKKELIEETPTEAYYKVSSGYPVSKLVNETVSEGLEGIEYHLGLPGSVGGAIYMNSKWTNPEDYFGDHLTKAYVLTKSGEIKEVNRSYFDFAYDYSILHKTGEILLDAVFQFKKANKKLLMNRSQKALIYRKQTQPFGVFTSGCFFRNISNKEKNDNNLDTNSAGYLIDQSGLKGKRIGGFSISKNHANFIINDGLGKPEDLNKLLKLIKSKVKAKFGIDLQEEVILVN